MLAERAQNTLELLPCGIRTSTLLCIYRPQVGVSRVKESIFLGKVTLELILCRREIFASLAVRAYMRPPCCLVACRRETFASLAVRAYTHPPCCLVRFGFLEGFSGGNIGLCRLLFGRCRKPTCMFLAYGIKHFCLGLPWSLRPVVFPTEDDYLYGAWESSSSARSVFCAFDIYVGQLWLHGSLGALIFQWNLPARRLSSEGHA